MPKEVSIKFESLDFCYDLIDLLKEKRYPYICIFLQISNELNKIQAMYGGFELKDCESLLPNITEFGMQNVGVKTIVGKDHDINDILKIIRKQNIEYVLLIINKENLEFLSYLKNGESVLAASSLLNIMPTEILKSLTEDENTDTLDENAE